MWSGVEVPTGFVLCNGSNGSPDLQGKFVRSSAPGSNTGQQGGGLSTYKFTTTSTTTITGHSLTTAEMPVHNHAFKGVCAPLGCDGQWTFAGPFADNPRPPDTTVIQNSGGGQPHSHSGATTSTTSAMNDLLPPYYVLAFIRSSFFITIYSFK